MAKPILLVRVPRALDSKEFRAHFHFHTGLTGMADEYWVTIAPTDKEELEMAVFNAPNMEKATFDYLEIKIKKWLMESL